MIAQPLTDAEIAAQLAFFRQDPVAAMNQQPPKTVLQDPGGPAPLPFSGSVAGNAFVPQRDLVRKQACGERNGQIIRLGQVQPGKAPFQQNDLADNLVDVAPAQILRTLEAIEARGLRSAQLAQSPWSSTYWPIYQGQLGVRYADPSFPAATDWKQNYTYVQQGLASDVVGSGAQGAIDNLSPAEKYDLLVGDADYTLTGASWSAGKGYYDSNGSVETWMGICHGWSPASYMMPRPVRPVTLTAASGIKITFYPDDIKALGCLLWASTSPVVRFIGGRCNDKDPATDPASGRLISQDCFDTNPGTWHLSVVNQIGVARRSLVIDASFDYEVWNQPVLGYRYSYFNPQTQQAAATAAEARVSRAGFTDDKFARWRSPAARSMVGIIMQLVYIAETGPSHAQSDSAGQDRQVQVTYYYDVEHDDSGAIIGGEWYLNKHPDFLWTPPPGGKAVSSQDGALSSRWTGGALPDDWTNAAAAASGDGQPLAGIVNVLFQMAK